ncbi:putative reverse transcriptase domain-containing protein [Tanacetum coccineum]
MLAPFNGSNGAKFCVGPPGYYTRTYNRPPYGEKRPSLEELMNKHQEESARRTTSGAPTSSTRECKAVYADHEAPINLTSSSKLNKLLGVSFLSNSDFKVKEDEKTTKVLQCQLTPKELNPRSFTLLYTIGNLNFYAMADLGASVNVMPRRIFEYLKLTNLRKTNMLVEMANMTKKASLRIIENILVQIDRFLFPSDFVIIDKTPNETINLDRPFLTTIHAEINVFKKEISLGIGNDRVSYDMEKKDHNFTTPTKKIIMIKSDQDNKPHTLTSGNNPLLNFDSERSSNIRDRSPNDGLQGQYNNKQKIMKLDPDIPRAHFYEYELRIGKKGHMFDKIWKYYKKVHKDSTYWWNDHGFKKDVRDEIGIEIEEYDPPEIQDHNLWDVIVIGDLEEESASTGEISAPLAPKIAKQLAAKRNQEIVKSILLLAIPNLRN